jgi:hypothetical protein
MARERMPDAGLVVKSQQDQWRPASRGWRESANKCLSGLIDGRRPGFREPLSVVRQWGSGSWLFLGVSGNWEIQKLRQGASVVGLPGAWTVENAATGSRFAKARRPRWGWQRRPQLASAAPTALLLEVGDAACGYSASPWTVLDRWLRAGASEGARQVAAGSAAQAVGSGVGDPADARDNKSVAEIGAEASSPVRSGSSESGQVGVAGRAKPIPLTRRVAPGQRKWCSGCKVVGDQVDHDNPPHRKVRSSQSKAFWVEGVVSCNRRAGRTVLA